MNYSFTPVCLSLDYCLSLGMNVPPVMLCPHTVVTQPMFGQVCVGGHRFLCACVCLPSPLACKIERLLTPWLRERFISLHAIFTNLSLFFEDIYIEWFTYLSFFTVS